MKLFYTLCLCFAIQTAFSCSCVLRADFKSETDLKEYDFIALVSIKKLTALDTVNRFMHLRLNGNIKVDVLELFKGEKAEQIVDQNFSSDCALELNEDEKWIFFGNKYNGKITVSKCSYSVIYQHKNGFRDWKFFTGLKQLDILRNIYAHRQIDLSEIKTYPDHRIEVKQLFKNGKLNSIRKIYYPNRHLYVAEKFKNGVRIGFRKIYTASGQLEYLVKYKNGLIKQRVAYQDTTENAWYLNYEIKHHNDLLFGVPEHTAAYFEQTLDSLRKLKHWEKKVRNIYNYSSDGRSYTNISYNYKGSITTKGFLDWDSEQSEEYHYYENGKVQYCVKLNQKANQQIEFDYDKNGKRRDFIKKCDSCQFYFNKNVLAALPEPGYVQ